MDNKFIGVCATEQYTMDVPIQVEPVAYEGGVAEVDNACAK